MRLLLDEMLPPAVAEALRRRGHAVSAVAEQSELRGSSDPEIFDLALAESRAIVTANVADFRVLAAEARSAGGEAPLLLFTSSRGWPRGSSHRIGRLVEALDDLLRESPDLAGEHWLD